MARKNRPPNDRERRFVEAYLGPKGGNGTKAALEAGYTRNRKSAAEIGSRLLRKVKIQEAVAQFQKAREKKTIANADERDQVLSGIMRDEQEQTNDRIAAAKELNKVSGRHSIKHVLDVAESLADIIAGSRE